MREREGFTVSISEDAVREAAGDLRDAPVEEIRADIEAEAKAEAREKDPDR